MSPNAPLGISAFTSIQSAQFLFTFAFHLCPSLSFYWATEFYLKIYCIWA